MFLVRALLQMRVLVPVMLVLARMRVLLFLAIDEERRLGNGALDTWLDERRRGLCRRLRQSRSDEGCGKQGKCTSHF
ncbi:hypothetical protein HYPGJ_30173 [Hyphomicrobium sp. GJ21]|nr:hypothetical protein HYPGJ_30173 [Hyphomicrobium sp. GJ21]